MSYQVEVREPIARQLRALPQETRRAIGYALHTLSPHPRPQGATKLVDSSNRYRIRIGGWRMVYAREDGRLMVLALRVADRTEVYRKP